MPSISIMYPTMPSRIESVVPYARLAEHSSGRRLWLGQSLCVETHAVFAALTGRGLDIGFGSDVALMPMRHPLTAAVDARSVAALSGRTYIAGIGPGDTEIQRRMLGSVYERPVSATRHYIRMMRTLLDGGTVEETEGPWATEGLRLPPMKNAPVEIGLGVLREPMARLAGEAADWAITWLTPVDYLSGRLMPAMAFAARAAQRPAPRVAALVHCAVARPDRDLARVCLSAVQGHLSAPHYTDMLNRAGVPVDRRDPRTGAELLVRHGVMATGTAQDIAAALGAYHAAGVDEVIISVGGVQVAEGTRAALRDLADILQAAEHSAPRGPAPAA